MGQFEREELLIGAEGVNRLKKARVAVFGIGGVGGFVSEALARAGLGFLDLVDKDTISESNLNRQIIALHSTIGRFKTEVMRDRILDINPQAEVSVHNRFFLPETADLFDFTEFDYVVDAVDTVTAKIELVLRCRAAGVPLISSMGTGNKLNPARFEEADIFQTSVCPLAKVMRKELRARGIESLKVVYSKEEPIRRVGVVSEEDLEKSASRLPPGSISFVPPAAGLVLAGAVVRDLLAAIE